MTAERLVQFVERVRVDPHLAHMELHRVYYYDAPPLEEVINKPLNGGEQNLGQTWVARANKALLEHLREAPFFALRLGELAFSGWGIVPGKLSSNGNTATIGPDDLRPIIRQKGVDMRIGMDIASLTLKRLVDVIVLVTGDSDFVPAMKFARREGVQLFLVTFGHGVKPELKEHADILLAIG